MPRVPDSSSGDHNHSVRPFIYFKFISSTSEWNEFEINKRRTYGIRIPNYMNRSFRVSNGLIQDVPGTFASWRFVN
ncbi:hypothetical protein F01_200126 [Burkholderia cenocepacia]|nr:hypothetical protein F01_200126 [Burkholderia cenocepacia]